MQETMLLLPSPLILLNPTAIRGRGLQRSHYFYCSKTGRSTVIIFCKYYALPLMAALWDAKDSLLYTLLYYPIHVIPYNPIQPSISLYNPM